MRNSCPSGLYSRKNTAGQLGRREVKVVVLYMERFGTRVDLLARAVPEQEIFAPVIDAFFCAATK